jgi:putative RNA 2'-phosphotransferase
VSGDVVRLSKRLSWLLRHGAGGAGLVMDEAGWAAIDDVLHLLSISLPALEEAVARNDKGRLVVEGARIRACQGHSLSGMPVTVEALESSWEVASPAGHLWHGTHVAAVAGIAAHGIVPGGRSHVHLAPQRESRIGKRSAVDLLLEVSPARLGEQNITVFQSPNGVLLVRRVPLSAIVGLEAASLAGRQSEVEARRRLQIGT